MCIRDSIKTARTEKAINEAAKAGFRPLLKEVKPSEEIHSMVSVYQNKKTGEIELSGDVRWAPGPPEEYEHVLKYRFLGKFSARF